MVNAQAFDRCVVNAGDQVTGFEADTKGGRAFDGGDNFHQAVFHRHLDANANKLADRAFAEFFEALFVEVLRVRVQPGHHACDGVADEFFLVHTFNVVALDHAKHRCQLLQFFQRQGAQSVARNSLNLHRGQCASDGAQSDETGDFQLDTHGNLAF